LKNIPEAIENPEQPIDVKTTNWNPFSLAKKVNPDEIVYPITMHNMSVVIDQVEPHILERLDLDLS